MRRLRGPGIHLTLGIVWVLLVIPTLLVWNQSVLWVAFMSLYANVAGHWSSYQAARAERKLDGVEGDDRVPGV